MHIIKGWKSVFTALTVCTLVSLAAAPLAAETPRNVVLLIGDGMGFEQVKAAGLYACGRDGRLAMQRLPHAAEMTTDSLDAPAEPTDSAAAGTAMACGVKVHNGVVSMTAAEDGRPLETMLEHFQDRGKRTGLVTTTYLTHATPASFGAHARNRNRYDEIARGYLENTRPVVLMGGHLGEDKQGRPRGMSAAAAKKAGYRVATSREELARVVQRARGPNVRLCGLFGTGHMPYEHAYAIRADNGYDTLPHLSEMTRAAIRFLERTSPEGFFLMVEGGRIDHAGHDNLLPHNVAETLEFDSTVRDVVRWAAPRGDTLVVVTADHECGGLKVEAPRGVGRLPEVSWSSTHHTRAPVPVYAGGPGAERFRGIIDNTDLFALLTGVEKTEPVAEAEAVSEPEDRPVEAEPAYAP
jgi:alkaline phosphatase